MLLRVVFKGSGYNFGLSELQKIGGFFVAVIVESDSVDLGIQSAYEKLVCSKDYIEIFAEHENMHAEIEVDTVYELSEILTNESEISGYIFYPPEEEGSDETLLKH